MRTPSRWSFVSRLPAGRLGALTDRQLARYVRDELRPFSAGYRELLSELVAEPSRATLAELPTLGPEDLLAAERGAEDRERFWLRPTAAEIARRGSFGQRLALRLGGKRAARALEWGYAPVTSVVDSAQPGPSASAASASSASSASSATCESGPRFLMSAHDVALAGESGARALGELGLDEVGQRTIFLDAHGARLARLALFGGASQLGARLECASTQQPGALLRLIADLRPTALIGERAELLRCLELAQDARSAHGLGELSLLGVLAGGASVAQRAQLAECAQRAHAGSSADPARVAALFAPAWARQVFAERPAAPAGSDGEADREPAGFCSYPDLGLFEVLDARGRRCGPGVGGTLVYTALAGHGLPAFRYRTGLVSSGGLSAPVAGVPRLAADLSGCEPPS